MCLTHPLNFQYFEKKTSSIFSVCRSPSSFSSELFCIYGGFLLYFLRHFKPIATYEWTGVVLLIVVHDAWFPHVFCDIYYKLFVVRT